jgi:acetyl-CoA synthetase
MSANPPPSHTVKTPRSYVEACAAFSLDEALSWLSWGGGVLNPATICCDRHCGADRVALTWVRQDRSQKILTFEDLRDLSARFAHVLRRHGVGPGDRVAGLLPRTPELLATILGTWRAGGVYQPLFTAFGPKAIEHRIRSSGAKLVVTDTANRAKLDDVIGSAKIATVTDDRAVALGGDIDFARELERSSSDFAPIARALDDPFLILFTSGTTGPAKPVLVPIRAIAAFMGYMRDAVGLQDGRPYWNIADPGWAYGLYYGIVGPLALGHSTLIFEGAFAVDALTRIVRDHGITHLAGAPTAFRQLIAAGPAAVDDIKGRLQAISSAGEPLNPEVIRWAGEHLAATIHDHYGQTETGMVLCNHHALEHPVHAGAAGFAVPGHRVVILGDDDQELPPGMPGALALDRLKSPLFWFSGYEGQETPALGARYYRSGDTAELNADGSISFVGRADDVISSSGYRIGPFDVESALLEHPAVVEAAAIGKPDPLRTEIVKAFVVLHPTRQPSDALAEELRMHVRQRLSAHAYPREIEFVESLPKTPSGKIQRFLLRREEIAKGADQPPQGSSTASQA